ncbi:MAG: penicillin-binding protein 2 [Thermoleophilia bacterium]|nr:penicillin-binding protein 2 [Gaiellaceae bacterium]MDW8338025.1 penicillin-binding protein 2 [Thermoleophilia bacterium]
MPSSPYEERRLSSRRFLPPDPRVQEPHRLTPQLALRVAILGVLTLLVFGVLFVRLWSLQVLSGDDYLRAAQNNQLRLIRLEAPRGPILDRNGRVLVTNVAGTAVKLWVGDMPPRRRFEIVRRLAQVLDVSPRELAREVAARLSDPLTPITVKTAVGEAQVHYLYEHRAEFPGVEIVQTYLRHYPYKSLAAHVLGYVGEISAEELARLRKDGYRPGDTIGKTGIEAAYDAYLRGVPGLAQVTVDSLGRPRSGLEPRQEPRAGSALRLTIDVRLQRAAEEALAYGIRLARANGHWAASGGAIVALDPRDGAVLAMASSPTYRPSLFVGRVERRQLAPLLDEEAARRANYPGLNRAIAGLYPPGSTWKPVTALAGMQEHVFSAYGSLPCTPFATYGLDRQRFRNWNPYVNRPMTLPEALAESCDTYFYEIGNRFYELGAEGRVRMQQWARRFGFGAPTGIDIPGEQPGLVPTPEWRRRTFSSDWDRAWNPGDSIQLAIGQKDLLVTPLQMAAFYAMLANGGNVVTPYLAASVEQPGSPGSPRLVLRRFAPKPPRPAGVDAAALAAVRDGLWRATHSTNGTASGVFGAYEIPISGKTGTAEKVVQLPGYPAGHLEDQSWWCGWGPSEAARLVVCALIENGGHGSAAAAPAALRVFERFFGRKAPEPRLAEVD